MLLEEGVCYDQCALSGQNPVSLCPLFCTPRTILPVTPSISYLPIFGFQSIMMKRISFFGVSSRRYCRSSNSASLALLVGAYTWITMVLNGLPSKPQDLSVIFEITGKFCILDSFVDHHGYSKSSKGFLPAVVDIMVI